MNVKEEEKQKTARSQDEAEQCQGVVGAVTEALTQFPPEHCEIRDLAYTRRLQDDT